MSAGPVVGVMTDLWPSASERHSGPYVRDLTLRLLPRARPVVLVPRLLFRRAHGRVWGTAAQGWQRGHESPTEVRVLRYPMLRIPKGTETRVRALGARAALALRRERIDLVHGHFLYAVGPAAVRLARRLRVPVLLTAHGTDVRWLGDRRDEIQRRHRDEMLEACRRADAITVVARWMVDDLVAGGVDGQRISVVPMGIDETVFRPQPRDAVRARLDVAPDERVILFVGRATPEKGAAVLQRALAGQPVRCYVAGPLPLEGCTHLGTIEPALLADWMSASDVLCLPSFSEGTPVSVSEALACGTPVVASAVGGVPDQVQPGLNGFVVPPGDPEALRSALADALDREWDRDTIRATSEPFWWPGVARRFADLYDRLLKR